MTKEELIFHYVNLIEQRMYTQKSYSYITPDGYLVYMKWGKPKRIVMITWYYDTTLELKRIPKMGDQHKSVDYTIPLYQHILLTTLDSEIDSVQEAILRLL